MERIALYNKIRSTLAHIVVLDGDDLVGAGSGVCCGSQGELITAAHVVTGGWPIRPELLQQPGWRILVSVGLDGPPRIYVPIYCPIQIKFTTPGIEAIDLDLALLRPAEMSLEPLPYFTADIVPPVLGEEVYIAGYSEEIKFPFGLDRLVAWNVAGSDKFKSQFKFGVKARIGGPMIKRGFVGNVVHGAAMDRGKPVLQATVFFVDNHLHRGASGGPIIGAQGRLKGIVIKRAMTSSEPIVPSGSCIGIALDALKALSIDAVNVEK